MDETTKKEINGLSRKLKEFQKQGLESYRAYLQKEHDNAKDKPIKKLYFDYIVKEMAKADEKIESLSQALNA